MLHNEGTKALNNNNNNNNNNSLFAPITVIHLFVCVYECYNNVHDNSEQETLMGLSRRVPVYSYLNYNIIIYNDYLQSIKL